MKKIIFLLFLLSNCSTVFAAENSLLGIVLGKKLSEQKISKCDQLTSVDVTCFEEFKDSAKIQLSTQESPSYVKDGKIWVQLIDGKIEYLSFDTDGYKVQDEVFKALKDKYGSPFWNKSQPYKNMFGKQAIAYQAIWLIFSDRLYFSGFSNQIDRGSVIFSTKKFQDELDIKEAQKKLTERSL